jgi:hypothetical protein
MFLIFRLENNKKLTTINQQNFYSKMNYHCIKVNLENNGAIIRLPSDIKSMGYDLYEYYWYCHCYNDGKMRSMTLHFHDFPVKSIMEGYCPCSRCKELYK